MASPREQNVEVVAPWTGERKHYRGVTEILEFFGMMMAGVKVLRVDVDQIAAVDDERVIALYTEMRQEPDAPQPYPLDVGIVYTLEDGMMARVQVHSDHEAARATAGV